MAKTSMDVFATFFDEGKYTTMYTQKSASISVGVGFVCGSEVVSVAQNGNALCAADMKKWVRAIELAGKIGVPLFTFYASSGAVLDGGVAPLTGYADILKASANVSGVVPQIAVVTGTCGGNSALLAATSDICVMSEEGELFLTPPYTAAATGKKTAGAGSAASAADSGVAHIVVKTNAEAVLKAQALAELLPSNNLTVPSLFEESAPSGAFQSAAFSPEKAVAGLADSANLVSLFDNIESVYVALGTVDGTVTGFVATDNGKGICTLGAAKAARFVRLCDMYNIPVVTVLATCGFTKSSENDIAGGIRNAALLASTYSDATTAKVLVVAGQAIGAAYTAFSACDVVIAADGAVVSPLAPEAAATVVYAEELKASKNIPEDTKKYAAEYIATYCNADALDNAGICEVRCNDSAVRGAVADSLAILATKRVTRQPKKYGSAL